MGMKEPKHEAQSKICDYLSVPGPQEKGAHLPEANLVSSAKDVDESTATLAPNLVGITHAGGGGETKYPG